MNSANDYSLESVLNHQRLLVCGVVEETEDKGRRQDQEEVDHIVGDDWQEARDHRRRQSAEQNDSSCPKPLNDSRCEKQREDGADSRESEDLVAEIAMLSR